MLARLKNDRFAAKTGLGLLLGGFLIGYFCLAIGGSGPCGPSSVLGALLLLISVLLMLGGMGVLALTSLRAKTRRSPPTGE